MRTHPLDIEDPLKVYRTISDLIRSGMFEKAAQAVTSIGLQTLPEKDQKDLLEQISSGVLAARDPRVRVNFFKNYHAYKALSLEAQKAVIQELVPLVEAQGVKYSKNNFGLTSAAWPVANPLFFNYTRTKFPEACALIPGGKYIIGYEQTNFLPKVTYLSAQLVEIKPLLVSVHNVATYHNSLEEVEEYLSRAKLRLPSEEEWEVAARAGNPGRFPKEFWRGTRHTNPFGLVNMGGEEAEVTSTEWWEGEDKESISVRDPDSLVLRGCPSALVNPMEGNYFLRHKAPKERIRFRPNLITRLRPCRDVEL